MTTDTETRLLACVPTGLYIDGEWSEATGAERLPVHDPATDRELLRVADATAADAARAMDAAARAARSWAKRTPRVRADYLRAAFDKVIEHGEELALLITLEMGKPLSEARAEVAYGAEFLRWFGEEATRISGRYSSRPEGGGQAVISRSPIGPCLLITPWNFPLAMATRKIAPALAAGCTVVIKPAALSPLTTLFLARILQEIDLPHGVVNVITTSRSGETIGPLLEDRRLRKLSFTGSTAVGRTLLRQAASNVLRCSMELGGNAPFLVFDDADVDLAVSGALTAKFRNMGQACTAANRVYVQRSVLDAFSTGVVSRVREMTIGRGTEPGVDIGPLIDAAAVAKVDELVQDAVARGASVLCGGRVVPGAGSFYEPTVLIDVPAESRILGEEIFGPVMTIVPFDTEDEAVALANDTEYGLMSYAYTESLDRGHRMIDGLETGIMAVNAGVASNAAYPFGGVKHSGMGREGGTEGIDEYLTTKYSLIRQG